MEEDILRSIVEIKRERMLGGELKGRFLIFNFALLTLYFLLWQSLTMQHRLVLSL